MTIVATSVRPTAERWRQLPVTGRVIIVAAAAATIVFLLLGQLASLYSSPNSTAIGPASSLASDSSGTAAFADLLQQRHYHVQQLTSSTLANMPAGSTVFVLDPVGSITSDLPALKSFVNTGGHVVLAGQPAQQVLEALLPPGPLPTWEPNPIGQAHPSSQDAFDSGIETVVTGSGGWILPGSATPKVLLASHGHPYALETGPPSGSGNGTVVLLATATPLENTALDQQDDAAFGLDLAGPAGATVVFDEYVHGFGRPGGGLAGLPAHWQAAVWLTVLAVALWMVSASKRQGPPQRKGRPLIPARVVHVDSLAELIVSGPKEKVLKAAGPLQDRARHQLRRLLQTGPDATDAELSAIVARTDHPLVNANLVASLLANPTTPEQLLALSQTLAQLELRLNPKGNDS